MRVLWRIPTFLVSYLSDKYFYKRLRYLLLKFTEELNYIDRNKEFKKQIVIAKKKSAICRL
jgi:hypothetical protein